jgi:ribonuclease E
MPPHAEPGAAQPELPPVYLGPTPANPFGSHAFDIFDVMEQVEQSAAVPAVATLAEEMPPVPPASPPAVEPGQIAIAAVLEAEPEPTQSEAAEREIAAPPEAVLPVTESAPPIAANDVTPEPVVKPIIIGSDAAAVVEKKRGWWRR